MHGSLPDNYTSISIGGIHISNLKLADTIDLFGGTSRELQDLTSRLYENGGAYGLGSARRCLRPC
ncbi:hypothetical protein DPMN_049737 [Dreissena polymorpha]|uniref:Uncharacterized protein n=1 Tax=Dreissena polymorpha TaxID=45954 RepID=A0A9D4HLK7_DREPO|nr:hypothetical protein DPMN_049737 [Dreissena polymorpha]